MFSSLVCAPHWDTTADIYIFSNSLLTDHLTI